MKFTIQDVEAFKQELKLFRQQKMKSTALLEWGGSFIWFAGLASLWGLLTQVEHTGFGMLLVFGVFVISICTIPLLGSSLVARLFENNSFWVHLSAGQKEQQWLNQYGVSWEGAQESVQPLSHAEAKALLSKIHEHGLSQSDEFQGLLRHKQACGQWVKGHQRIVEQWIEALERQVDEKEVLALEQGLAREGRCEPSMQPVEQVSLLHQGELK